MSYKLNRTGAQIDAIFNKVDTIFFATYGTTTYAEITTAISGGKRVFLFKGAQLYAYKGVDAVNSAYVFGQLQGNIDQPAAGFAYCTTGSSWGTEDVPLATLQQYYESLMEDTVSGSIASFPDGANDVPIRSMKGLITPIQDLHGYDNPWPAGGGKNLIPNVNTWTTMRDITITKYSDGSVHFQGTVTGGLFVYTFYDGTGGFDLNHYSTVIKGLEAGKTVYFHTGDNSLTFRARYTDSVYSGAIFPNDTA